MKEAMRKWLNQRQITFDPNTANSICDKFGLDGEKADECLGLCYQLESDKITQAEFTGGLCVLTGKEPEEVMGVLRGVKGARPKMTWDELDKKAIALFIKRHGREAYESGEIGEMLERIEQRAEEYDPVFLSKHPELKGKSITVYHDPLAGEDWAVVNNETGEVVEIFNEEMMGMLKGIKPEVPPAKALFEDTAKWWDTLTLKEKRAVFDEIGVAIPFQERTRYGRPQREFLYATRLALVKYYREEVLKGIKGKENPMTEQQLTNTEAEKKLEAINKKWRELDELQITTHLECMSARKWAVLNSLDAIGLELTKGYTAIGSYIDEKMETIELALKDLKSDEEIDARY